MAKMLAVIPAKNPEDVKMVAAALKSAGTKFEKVYLDWAQPYGRFKAKGLWAKVPADPDAMTEVLERHLLASTRKARFKPQTAAELDPTPMQYLIKGVAPAQGLLVIYGPSGSAKSFLSIAAAAAIGEGSSFFGYAATPAPVLYVGLEGEAGVPGNIGDVEQAVLGLPLAFAVIAPAAKPTIGTRDRPGRRRVFQEGLEPLTRHARIGLIIRQP